jgi:small-conductance mechanosensitive channel
MTKLEEFTGPIWSALNHPILVLGKSSITLWLIILNLILIVVFLFVIAKLKNWLISALSTRPGVNISNWRAAITLGYYAVLGIGMVGILQSSGLDLSLFTVLTGAIGIGVGFGMQSIFSNFISGVIILIEKPLKLGDRIEIADAAGNSVAGNVHSISVRATTIITNENVSIIIPNADFISKQVINWSHSGKNVRLSISVNVSYDTDAELVEKLLLKAAGDEVGVLKSPPPTVRLAEFGESGILFKLLVWTDDYSDRTGALKSLLNLSVLKSFREHQVQMPFPRREIYLHPASTMEQADL